MGSDFAPAPDSDLVRMLKQNGMHMECLANCKTVEEYYNLAAGKVIVSAYPLGKDGAAATAERLGIPHLHLPMNFSYDENERNLKKLATALNIKCLDIDAEITRCEEALEMAQLVVRDTPIEIDAKVHPRPLSLARLLLDHGFNVTTVYLDSISAEEEKDFKWLQHNFPNLLLVSASQTMNRVIPRGSDEKTLALGPLAAWYTDTPYFVNVVQGGDLIGFGGICRMCDLMADAFQKPKDTEQLVPLKGLGCESCV